MRTEKRKLLEKHDKELKANQEHHITNIANLENERERSTRPLVSALGQIKAKKGTITISGKPNSMTMTRDIDSGQSPLSPRTQEIYTQYKSEKRKTRLDVKPVEEKKESQKKRVVTSRSIKRPVTATSRRGKFNPKL